MPSEVLSQSQIDDYNRDGFIVLENRIPDDIMDGVRAQIEVFVEEARGMTAPNDRIDLEDTHTPESPRVRRIKLPHTLSDVFRNLMLSDWILAPVRDLIGPDLRLHTTKLNMKSAGYGAAVEWHQDWAYYPHTNNDVLAVGVIIDDMGEENGPLMVFPGTHSGPIFDHHANGYFAGAMDMEACGLDIKDAVALEGPAGSISIHHGRIVHGSGLNRSTRDRRMMFIEITAADAYPICGTMTKYSTLEDYDTRMLCGKSTTEPRLANVPVRIPAPLPASAGSIYEIQKQLKARSFDQISRPVK